MTPADITAVFLNLEGPYKWYVIVFFIVISTAVFSRIVFKTIKWFVILICLGVIGAAIWTYLLQ